MKELGRVLKAKREQLGLDLNEVQTLTKIRKRYLLALEEGDWSILPGDVYARGFVRSYAECLGLDGRVLLEQYVELHTPSTTGVMPTPATAQAAPPTPSPEREPELATPVPSETRQEKAVVRPSRPARDPRPSRPVRDPRRSRKGSSGVGQAVAVIAALAVLGGGWWALSKQGNKSSAGHGTNATAVNPGNAVNAVTSNDTSNSTAVGGNTTNATTNQTSAGTPSSPQVQVVAQPFQNNLQTYTVTTNQPITVVLNAVSGECWVKVTADGNVIDGSDTLSNGQTKTWQANQSMTIRVGNVPGVTLTINGQAVTLPITNNAIDVQVVKAQA